jgi:hypothetical protein
VPKPALFCTLMMPPLTTVPLVYVFAVGKTKVPRPALVSAPGPVTGLMRLKVRPAFTLKVPPPEAKVTPLLALFIEILVVGCNIPAFRVNCAGLKLAGLPPRLFSAPNITVWLLLIIIGPVNAVLFAV